MPLKRLESRKRRRGAASCPACGGPEEDATHFVFTCVALHAVRDQLYSRLDAITTGVFGQLMYDEPLDTALLGLLGDNYWGEQATAVDSSCAVLPGGGLGCTGGSGCCPGADCCVSWRWLWILSRSLHR
jgi:hypothetical protein